MMLFILIVLFVCCFNCGIAQDEPVCKTENTCDCCKSNPENGGRNLWEICRNQDSDWSCVYGCIDGYWGGKCWSFCPASCISCHRQYDVDTNNNICYSCVDGYYGTNCGTNCPTNCAANKCDQTTGNCLHGCTSSKWSGDRCNFCADTWYGDNCDIRCPDYCKNRICDSNGDCTACADENLDVPRCDRCKGGTYGDNCDIDCPVNCKDDTCYRVDGICLHGCNGNFFGDKCDKCMPGYYGVNCNNRCYNCMNGVCDRSTGRCTDCANGKFGEQCDKFCSSGCNNSVCDRNTAFCSEGCWTGYSGDKCCVFNTGCEICDTTTSCSKCNFGFYGNSCGRICNTNCTGACDKVTGHCEACKEGKFYGDLCGKSCPTECLDGQCDKEDGRCLTCKKGYFDGKCEDKCPEVCLNGECSREKIAEPQTSCHTGEIIGGIMAAVVIIITLNNVIWFVWTRRQTKDNKKDPGIHTNAIYVNDQADPDGYEELQVTHR